MSPGVCKREPAKFRVVYQGGVEKVTPRTKAKDRYEAFEQVSMFLRSKGFDYRVVPVEPS